MVFSLHLLFGHIAFDNFIICIENDGSISFENTYERAACCSNNTMAEKKYPGDKLLDAGGCDSCNDLELVENCDEQYTQQYKKHDQISSNLQLVSIKILDTEIVENTILNKTNQINLFQQLKLNRSIVLLI